MPASPDDGAARAARVSEALAETERLLLARLAQALTSDIDQADWAQRKLAELRLFVASMTGQATRLQVELAESIRAEVMAA